MNKTKTISTNTKYHYVYNETAMRNTITYTLKLMRYVYLHESNNQIDKPI